jgi:ubiquinone/menaquinone biosynthesis C-methylase UbiE
MNDDQTALWNGSAGQAWVDTRELLDQLWAPIERLLVESLRCGSDERVLDVGCGTGATTLAAARQLGAGGHAVGLDLSAPMIDVARDRARREGSTATFICADAQSYSFEASSFDVLLSRFGVMFFDDPVRAFNNLRSAARDGAALRFIAWRGPGENPFMTTAERAAAPLLPQIPARQPDAPGQFAFADAQRVRRILEESGWREIEARPIDVACTFPESELIRYVTRLGPLSRILHDADDKTRTHVIETVRRAFDEYVSGADVRFVAACWWVGARAQKASTRDASPPSASGE